jgi:hypothetical protein
MIVGDSSPPSPSTPNPNLARVSLELEKKLGGGEDGGEKKNRVRETSKSLK